MCGKYKRIKERSKALQNHPISLTACLTIRFDGHPHCLRSYTCSHWPVPPLWGSNLSTLSGLDNERQAVNRPAGRDLSVWPSEDGCVSGTLFLLIDDYRERETARKRRTERLWMCMRKKMIDRDSKKDWITGKESVFEKKQESRF